MKGSVDAVFFDAGLTLLAPHPSFDELFADVLAGHGHVVEPQRVGDAFAQVAPTFLEVLDRLGVKEWTTSLEASKRFWGEVYRSAFAVLGIEDDGRLTDALYERFTRYESYRLYPDAVPAIQELKESGLVVGLISNFEGWLEGMLIEMEVAHLFEVMVVSGVEGVEKPAPEIFLAALERTGSRPDRSVYIGDHPRIDVEGAEAVGMRGILIDREGRYPDHPGTRVKTLSEVPPLLRRKVGGGSF